MDLWQRRPEAQFGVPQAIATVSEVELQQQIRAEQERLKQNETETSQPNTNATTSQNRTSEELRLHPRACDELFERSVVERIL